MKKCTLEDFEQALFVLDKKLVLADLNIEIKAIGGFAMMYYGFRENGYTIDIDSLTPKYDDVVEKLIRETAIELSIEEDWLNTDCSNLEGFLDELSDQITWNSSKYDFIRIDLKIADIVGLIRSKDNAIHDGGIVPRSTDKKDLLAGLSKVGINNIDELNDSTDYDFIRNEYERCYEFLKTQEAW